jgi:hypothetical protein
MARKRRQSLVAVDRRKDFERAMQLRQRMRQRLQDQRMIVDDENRAVKKTTLLNQSYIIERCSKAASDTRFATRNCDGSHCFAGSAGTD